MKLRYLILLLSSLATVGHAQTAVTGVEDHQKLLASPDPKLAANKKLVYDFWREVFDAGNADAAYKYLAEPYIQHNPSAPNGIAPFVEMTKRWRKPQPVEDKVKIPIVSILAEGDMVMFSFVRELPDPADPSKKYSTMGVDLFRIKDGKIVEHWDALEKRNFDPAKMEQGKFDPGKAR